MNKESVLEIIKQAKLPDSLKFIANKIIEGERITEQEGILLYEKGELGYLGTLANYVREKKHGDSTYFNRNIHIEPTNICIYNCRFCSYSRKFNEEGAYELNFNEIENKIKEYKDKNITEIHIVGGVHPNRDLHYYGKLIKRIKNILPDVHIKAFTAVELDFMFSKSHMTYEEGLTKLMDYGLDSIPGGGAEIFDEEIRKQISCEKSSSKRWLKIHETAHKLGIKSNATMLYGHIENYSHRIDHLSRLRQLQDNTGGFQAFIPLKYRNKNNKMSDLQEVTTIEDLKNYAVSRIFLDNFEHIKAYWIMIGKDIAQLSLSFGVDDIDGTIDDSTKIYTMAGMDESSSMTTDDLVELIRKANRKAVERDTLYKIIKEY